ncbi:protein transport protein Sec24A [Drosophila eugracilis]|uniref:protein transport protein Sec24A n=1 Tax=Drosophila eugracilis TaxID=29029 RepID=UPI0007E62B0C|nr:protein transport protein Sec24A [Drosophila eugracilis]XP_017066642.1 protein transport protein Sec24A [Drosophila eugracilis]XP_017066643.1 protein transport protein Sec24A [Drosophila eugracilis]
MSTYNPNIVPPAHAPMPLNGNNLVNGLPGGVQQQPGPPTGQPYLPQKQPQQFQQPPPTAAYPGAPGNLPPPPQFNSSIASQFLPTTTVGAPPQQQLPPSTLPPHLRPPTVNGPPLTNGSNGASSANSSRTASPRPVAAAPQYAQGPIAATPNNPPLASGLRPAPQPVNQSLANLTSNLENLNLNTNRTNGGASVVPPPQQQYPPLAQKDYRGVATAQSGPPQFSDASSLLAASGVVSPVVPNAMATPFSQKPPNLAPHPAKMFGSASVPGRPAVPPEGQRMPYGVPPTTNSDQQNQQNNNLQRAAPPPGAGTTWPNSLPKASMPGSQPLLPPQQQQIQTRPYPYSQAYQSAPQQQPPLPQSAVQPPGMFGAQPTAAPLQYQAQAPPQVYGQQPQQPPQAAPGGPYGTPAPPNVAQQGFSRLWGQDTIDLMQNRHILSPATLPPPKVILHNQFHESINCSRSIMRCTLTKIPESNSLLQKSRLPLGIVIHPFRDVNSLPVIQCINIVRCRLCRTYINPFVYFVDSKMWKCNLCYRVNELPDDFQFDPATKTYGDVARRPEVRSSTIEFIAPSEYMLRPPQPAMYLFLFDVSIIAQQSGYLEAACATLNRHLDEMPGDARTQVGFICFDSFVHFYSMAEGLNQPHEMTLLDIEDIFLPRPDSLLVNLKECKELVRDLLKQLPKRFAHTHDPGSALGAALQVAFKLMQASGGRITVFQSCLPNKGPGALEPREDPNNRSAKDVAHLNPATDFYKRFALECSGYQIACDLFLMNQQYSDMATISGISKHSGGCVHHFPLYQKTKPHMVDSFRTCFKRYLTRKIGFEAVMRIRCTRGLQVHTFHGNFFVRSTDLLSLPNVNPDAGYGMQISYDESLTDVKTICFQAALLYTNSEGERRIRVHTVCLPVTASLPEVMHSADTEAIIGLLSKMAVDRSVASNLSDARDAFINATIDVYNAFKIAQNLPSGQSGQLIAPRSLALLPLYILGLLKHPAFRVGTSTRLDDRVFAMDCMKTLPLDQLMKYVYPELYKIDALIYHARNSNVSSTQDDDDDEEEPLPEIPRLQLSAEHLDSRSIFLMDCGTLIMLYVGLNVPPDVLEAVLGISSTAELGDYVYGLPNVVSNENDVLKRFILRLNYDKPYPALVQIIRDTSTAKGQFIERLTDDRSESSLSYYEFLQHIRAQVK